jgi:hypothetical protein
MYIVSLKKKLDMLTTHYKIFVFSGFLSCDITHCVWKHYLTLFYGPVQIRVWRTYTNADVTTNNAVNNILSFILSPRNLLSSVHIHETVAS